MQLFPLYLIHFGGSLIHEVGGLQGLGEGDHVPDGLSAGHDHHQAIESGSNATMRGCSVFQRIQEEAKAFLKLFFREAQHVEYLFLHIIAVAADASAGELHAVAHQII